MKPSDSSFPQNRRRNSTVAGRRTSAAMRLERFEGQFTQALTRLGAAGAHGRRPGSQNPKAKTRRSKAGDGDSSSSLSSSLSPTNSINARLKGVTNINSMRARENQKYEEAMRKMTTFTPPPHTVHESPKARVRDRQ